MQQLQRCFQNSHRGPTSKAETQRSHWTSKRCLAKPDSSGRGNGQVVTEAADATRPAMSSGAYLLSVTQAPALPVATETQAVLGQKSDQRRRRRRHDCQRPQSHQSDSRGG